MRLIDADELLRKLPREELVSRMIVAGMSTINPVLRDLENGITYAPVRRGRWKVSTNDGWVCSECGVGNMYAYSWDINGYKLQDRYCPHCGARMEEQE
jgi:rubrerythrin